MAEDDAKYYRQEWMSDDQWECAQMFADICHGWHHVPGKIKRHGTGIRGAVYAHKMATCDYHDLTRLVVMAHDRCIRVELAPSAPRRIGLIMHKRHTRTGAIMDRHPTIHEAVEKWHDPNYPQPEGGDDAEVSA